MESEINLRSWFQQIAVLEQMLYDRGCWVSETACARISRRNEAVCLLCSGLDAHRRRFGVYIVGRELNSRIVRLLKRECGRRGIDLIIIVSSCGLTTSGHAELKKGSRPFEVFHKRELSYNVTRHSLVPSHRVITHPGEKSDVLEAFGVESLPSMLESDPVAKYFGLIPGDVVEIRRALGLLEPEIFYRLVVSADAASRRRAHLSRVGGPAKRLAARGEKSSYALSATRLTRKEEMDNEEDVDASRGSSQQIAEQLLHRPRTAKRRKRNESQTTHTDLPVMLACGLYSFQAEAVAFLEKGEAESRRCSFLCVGQGLGKTVIMRRYIVDKQRRVAAAAAASDAPASVLFLTHTGLVAQTVELLKAERNLDARGANTGVALEQRMRELQTSSFVLVLNLNVRSDYMSWLNLFALVVVDEAHKKVGLCASIARWHNNLVILSGTPIRPYRLPTSTTTFVYTKTAAVVKEAMIAPVSTQIAESEITDGALARYISTLASTCITRGAYALETSALIYCAMHRAATQSGSSSGSSSSSTKDTGGPNLQLSRVWASLSSIVEEWAETIVEGFGVSLEKCKKKNISAVLRKHARCGHLQRIEYIQEESTTHARVDASTFAAVPRKAATSNLLSGWQQDCMRATTDAVSLHRHAFASCRRAESSGYSYFRQSDDFSSIVALVGRELLRAHASSPRLLCRVDDVGKMTRLLENAFSSRLEITSMNTTMPARAREVALGKFLKGEGLICKLATLRRGARDHLDSGLATIGKILNLGGGSFLKQVASFLIAPKILIVDEAGSLGFDLHRHVTAVLSAVFIPTAAERQQYCARVSRLAPECTVAPPPLTLVMPMTKSTLEETLFNVE